MNFCFLVYYFKFSIRHSNTTNNFPSFSPLTLSCSSIFFFFLFQVFLFYRHKIFFFYLIFSPIFILFHMTYYLIHNISSILINITYPMTMSNLNCGIFHLFLSVFVKLICKKREKNIKENNNKKNTYVFKIAILNS